MYHSADPCEEVEPYFTQYAEATHAEDIPLHESVYGLIMMRRHIWLSAKVQTLFTSVFDMHQAVDSINRVILLFDYGMYIVVQKYEEMAK